MPSTWLADALRAGGCRVDETVVPDWKSRGHTDGPKLDAPVGVLGHHTAGGAVGDLPSLRTVRDGRPDLAGPLANLMLSRAGVWVPIAAGRAWHAGVADSAARWPWVPKGDGNGYLIGIEAESTGTGDWTAAQVAAYPLGVAALLRHLGVGANRFLGHKEWAPSRKIDPAKWPGDMTGFRTTVTSILNGADDMALTDADIVKLWYGPRFRGDMNYAQVIQAMQDSINAIARQTQALDLSGRPGGATDDQYGHILSLRAEVEALAAKVNGTAPGTAGPVQISAADRAAIVADVVKAIQGLHLTS